MKTLMNILLGILIAAVLLFASGAFYTIDETQQVVITQFGDPIGEPIVKGGLHFKLPFIQQANYFEKRILQWTETRIRSRQRTKDISG